MAEAEPKVERFGAFVFGFYFKAQARDAQRLRPETRERILRIAAELGYQPNQLASSTRTGIVRSLALIGHFLTSTLYFSAAQIISGILSESTKQGYGVKMYDSADLKKAFAETVYKVKKNSLDMAAKHAGSMEALQKIIREQAELKKLRISLD